MTDLRVPVLSKQKGSRKSTSFSLVPSLTEKLNRTKIEMP